MKTAAAIALMCLLLVSLSQVQATDGGPYGTISSCSRPCPNYPDASCKKVCGRYGGCTIHFELKNGQKISLYQCYH